MSSSCRRCRRSLIIICNHSYSWVHRSCLHFHSLNVQHGEKRTLLPKKLRCRKESCFNFTQVRAQQCCAIFKQKMLTFWWFEICTTVEISFFYHKFTTLTTVETLTTVAILFFDFIIIVRKAEILVPFIFLITKFFQIGNIFFYSIFFTSSNFSSRRKLSCEFQRTKTTFVLRNN